MSNLWQTVLVMLVVAGAFVYSSWSLMPAAWRRSIKRRWGQPTAALSGAANTEGCRGGCSGCGGCGTAPAKTEPVSSMLRRENSKRAIQAGTHS